VRRRGTGARRRRRRRWWGDEGTTSPTLTWTRPPCLKVGRNSGIKTGLKGKEFYVYGGYIF
jgi:hypothetical protein